ncbi:hypothetical protein [Paenibacillus kobensis]|uniref:hypothetical protein n=1 Tax=Paenibacillus kobensis TaxID=59841 RepID=UPI000FD9F1F6|nr:hypothetical protein [Paenibacillus kobensis]
MSIRRKLYFVVIGLIVVLLVLPSPTAEWAVRKKLFMKFHPYTALTTPVDHGHSNYPDEGELYVAPKAELSFMFVKHGWWGYYVASAGTAP